MVAVTSSCEVVTGGVERKSRLATFWRRKQAKKKKRLGAIS